jgi:hypothetical protein
MYIWKKVYNNIMKMIISRAQNGYPKLISYLEAENFTFQPMIPLRSNSGLEYDPKLRKCSPRTTCLCSQIKTTSTNLKWVSKVDFTFGSKVFYFSTHNPTSFKLGACNVTRSQENAAQELHVSAQKSRPLLQLPNGYPKLISYLDAENFTFQLIIPLRSNLDLDCDLKLRKCGPRNTHLHSQINTMSPALKWVSKNDFIFGSEEFYLSTHNPTSFKLCPGM